MIQICDLFQLETPFQNDIIVVYITRKLQNTKPSTVFDSFWHESAYESNKLTHLKLSS